LANKSVIADFASASFATNCFGRRLPVSRKQEALAMDGKSLLIGALIVGMGILGYLYWDSQHNTVVKLPGVEIKKN
jgi:hypothetical protein